MKKVLFVLTGMLIVSSAFEYFNAGIGTNPSSLYLILSIVMLYILLVSKRNQKEIWSIPGIILVIYLDALINYLFYSIGGPDFLFFIYMIIFTACLVVAVAFLRKNKIQFTLNDSRIILYVPLSIILVFTWYYFM